MDDYFGSGGGADDFAGMAEVDVTAGANGGAALDGAGEDLAAGLSSPAAAPATPAAAAGESAQTTAGSTFDYFGAATQATDDDPFAFAAPHPAAASEAIAPVDFSAPTVTATLNAVDLGPSIPHSPTQVSSQPATPATMPAPLPAAPAALEATDYFGSSSGQDDPFSFASPPPEEPTPVAMPVQAAVVTQPEPVVAVQSTPPTTIASTPVPAVVAAPAAAPATVAAPVPAPAPTSSVSSYFGADDGGDFALGDSLSPAAPEAVAEAPAATAGSSSFDYFGGAPAADDPFGFAAPHAEELAPAPTLSSSASNYFDSAPADDWMNPTPTPPAAQPTHHQPPPQQQQPHALPQHHQPLLPQQAHQFDAPSSVHSTPSQAYRAVTAPAAVVAPSPSMPSRSHAQAPGGPVVSTSSTPVLPSSHHAHAQPPVDDYFASSAAGADDWLGGASAANPPEQPSSFPPHGAFPPHQQTQAPLAHAPTQTHAYSQQMAPPQQPQQPTSELFNDVDLGSPNGMADVSLGGGSQQAAPTPYMPAPTNGFAAYQHQQPERKMPRAPPQPQPVPFMPRASAEAPVNPYQPTSVPTQHTYGAEQGTYRPMPTPAPSQTMTPQQSPTTFMPRAPEPTAAASPQAHAPWQPAPAPTTYQPHQNGHSPAQQQPQQPVAQGQAHFQSQQQPMGGQSNLFAPTNLFSASGGGVTSVPRAWAPPPAHPLVCFGFGGRLLTMLPRSGSVPGPVQIKSLGEMLEAQPFVQRLMAFPGPLTLPPAAGAKHARHVELEDMVQNWADKALYAQLPSDSPLQAVGQQDPAARTQALGNFRTSKRLLYLLLLESLRHSGRIHRAANPAALTTLPADKEPGLEQAMVQYLVSMEAASGAPKPAESHGNQWLDNAASSHGLAGDNAAAPSPVRAAAGPLNGDNLVAERTQQDGVLANMQSLLLRGQRKEACALALEHRLWSHALLLASFDMATYHTVVGRFATQQFADGSPLQSLYVLFAQQPNLLFRGVAGPDGKGMDGVAVPGPHTPLFTAGNTPPLMRHWRANLSMLLANPTPNDKQVLTTLGDTLWQNYHLPNAAHMVYLLGGHALGPDLPGSTQQHALPLGRVLLLGADHRRHMRTFASPGALQRTEIFEYTKQLASASSLQGPAAYQGLSPAFQLFKLVYAHQLAEIGQLTRALAYCDQLTATVHAHGKQAGRGGTLVFPIVFLTALESLEARLREVLAQKAGPGVAKKIVNKLFNWMVGDNAQAPGTTTVVAADPTLSASTPALPRSMSSGAIPHPVGRSPALTSSMPPLQGTASQFNLQHHAPYAQQQQHHAPAHSVDYGMGGGGGAGANMNMSSGGGGQTAALLQAPGHSRSVTEPEMNKKVETTTPASATEGEVGAEPKKGIFGSIVGSFWSKTAKKKVPKADLVEENSFSFDEALGKWVQKDANGKIVEEEEEEKPPPPPMISDELKAKLAPPQHQQQPMPGAASPGAAPGGAPAMPGMPPPSLFAARTGGTKNRYALADASFEDTSSAPAVAALSPGLPSMFPTAMGGAATPTTPGAGPQGFKVFRPPPAPVQPVPDTTVPAGAAPPGQPQTNGAPAPFQPQAYGAPQSHPHPHQQPPAYGAHAPMPTLTPPPPSSHAPYGAPPPAHFQPGSAMPPYGYAPPPQLQQADLRAQSTPPMRPGAGTVPAGAMPLYGMPAYGGPMPPHGHAPGPVPLSRYAPQHVGAPPMMMPPSGGGGYPAAPYMPQHPQMPPAPFPQSPAGWRPAPPTY